MVSFVERMSKYHEGILDTIGGDIEEAERKLQGYYSAICETGDTAEKATESSIAQAIKRAVSLNLNPNKQLGQLFFGYHKRKCTLFVGYKGWVILAFRAKIVLRADIIRANDDYEYRSGSKPFIVHNPDITTTMDKRGPIIAAYCTWQHLEHPHTTMPEMMTLEEIEKVRACASKNSTAWRDWYERMAEKSAIIKATRTMPLSAAMEAAVIVDKIFVNDISIDSENAEKKKARKKKPSKKKLEESAITTVSKAITPATTATTATTAEKGEQTTATETETETTEEVGCTLATKIFNHVIKWQDIPEAARKFMRNGVGDDAWTTETIEEIERMTDTQKISLLDWMEKKLAKRTGTK